MPKVSIIVPVYGVEQYIDKCLKSLVNQTLKDIEMVIVNDGTKDNCQEIIDRYAKDDKRIKAVIKENGGQASARNMGIKLAKGDYLGFVDSDDWVEADMFEKLYNKAIEDDSDIVVCSAYMVTNDIKEKIEAINDDAGDTHKNYILTLTAPWNKLFKRELWIGNNIEFPEGIIYEDYAIIPTFVSHAKNISFVNDYLYNYLVRENSTMTQSKFNPKLRNILTASDLLFEKMDNNYFNEFEYLFFINIIREGYFRLRDIKDSDELISDMIDWYCEHFPKWKKNPYIRNKGFKYVQYSNLVTKKRFGMLNLLKKK